MTPQTLRQRAEEIAEEMTSKICMGKFTLSKASNLLAKEIEKALLSVREEAIRECLSISERLVSAGAIEIEIEKLLTPTKEGTNKGGRA